jgi:hypothetical protein
MEAVRKVMDSSILEQVIALPESLRNMEVEVLVFPHAELSAKTKKKHPAFGSLREYAKPGLIEKEEGALAKAMVARHADR